jgi:hypothetical protein
MSKIQANSTGTRNIDVSEEHLQTLDKYQLMRDVQESHGYVDEEALNKLKLNIRALLESDAGRDKALLDLCLDVVYHSHMKAFGLQHLIALYESWEQTRQAALPSPEAEAAT